MDDSIVLGNRNPFSQLLILVGIAFLSVAIFSFVAILLAQPLFGLSVIGNPNLFAQSENPAVIDLLKFMQVMQSIGLFVLPPLAFSLVYYRNISTYLQLNFKFKWSSGFAMVLIMVCAMPAINWMGEMNAQLKLPAALQGVENWMKTMETEAEQLTKSFLLMNSVSSLLFNLFMIALIPAIGEELLFRGAIQKILSEWTRNKHLGIWISAILFSALHMQFYGFIPRMLLGVLFGYVLVWSGSLWLPIIGHFVNNGSAVLVSYYEQRGKITAEVETFGSSADAYLYVALSFVLVGALMFFIKSNISHPDSEKIESNA